MRERHRRIDEPRSSRSIGLWSLTGTAAVVVLAMIGHATISVEDTPAQHREVTAGTPEGVVTVPYSPDEAEWPGQPPSLCEIIDHYELGAPARAATLYVNGRGAACASGSRRVSPGQSVMIAISAPPEFAQCVQEAAICR